MPKRIIVCPSCSKRLIGWGKSASGRQRYRCLSCNLSLVNKKPKTETDQFFILFRQYVLWGDTYEKLTSISGYSIQYLNEKFHKYLLTDPPLLPPIKQVSLVNAFLLIDGLWFGRWFVLMVYRQSKNLTILKIAVSGKEAATKISRDLRVLKSLYHFSGIVSDGATGIKRAVYEVFRFTPHQICLAHMHRAVVNAMGRHPKDYRVKELKVLADHVWLIESKAALKWWTGELKHWVRVNRSFLNEYRRDEERHWWYIHSGVRKAARILLTLPDISFKFLNYPLMPKTTNELEGQFNHLAHRWLAHRGLKRERWEKFMLWFVYFYNQEKLSQRKKKEDLKTNTLV